MGLLGALAAFSVVVESSAAAPATGQGARPALTMSTGALKAASISFSPDGRYMLTRAELGDVHLWDAERGLELREWPDEPEGCGGAGAARIAAFFAPDGRTIVAGARNGFLRIWSMTSGEEVRALPIGAGSVADCSQMSDFASSPDGARVLTAHPDGAVELRDLVDGKVLASRAALGRIRSIVFSPDGSSVAVGNDAGQLRVLETRQLGDRASISLDYPIASIAFAADGTTLGALAGESLRVWRVSNGTLVLVDAGAAATASPERTLSNVGAFAFSPDGRQVLAASATGMALRDAHTGAEIARFAGASPGEAPVAPLAFSPSGRTIATATANGNGVTLWDTAGRQALHRLASHAKRFGTVSASRDGRWILGVAIDGVAHVWNATTGRESLRVARPGYITAAISSGSRRLLIGVTNSEAAQILDLDSGRELLQLHGHVGGLWSIAFSPSGDQALTGDGRGTVRQWNTATGELVRQFTEHTQLVGNVAFCDGDRQVLGASHDGTARVWDAASGKTLHTFSLPGVYMASCSDDGAWIVTAGSKSGVQLWEAQSGKVVRNFDPPGEVGNIRAVSISGDGRQVLTTAHTREVLLWDATSGRELGRFGGHASIATAVAFLPDGRGVLTGSADGRIRVVSADLRQEVVQMVGFDDGSWAVSDHDGRYDARNGGENDWIYWVVGTETYALAQLKENSYDPGLLAKRLGFNTEPLRNVAPLAQLKLPPAVALNQPTGSRPVLHLDVTNRQGGIGPVRVLINGKQLEADIRPNPEQDANAPRVSMDLPLAAYGRWLKPGEANRIEVVAYDGAGLVSARGSVVEYKAPAASQPQTGPELWALVIGTSRFKSEAMVLRYSSRDAEAMADALGRGGRGLFGEGRVHIRLLDSDRPPEEQPTRSRIEAAFAELARQARTGDVVVVYLSGHGLLLDGDYYYPTQEAGSFDLRPQERSQSAIGGEELSGWLRSTPALKQVLLLDTCAAGAIEKFLSKSRGVPSGLIRALEHMKDRTGMFVLMGAAADRVSYEASEYAQGLLTYALLEGMLGGRVHDDGYVDIDPLMQYVVNRVPELAKDIGGVQTPLMTVPSASAASFDIARIDRKDRESIRLPSPRPRVLEPSIYDDDLLGADELDLGARVRARLRDASADSRGARTASMGVVYVDARDLPGSIVSTVAYHIDGKRVHLRLAIARDALAERSTMDCEVSDPDACADRVAQAIVDGALHLR